MIRNQFTLNTENRAPEVKYTVHLYSTLIWVVIVLYVCTSKPASYFYAARKKTNTRNENGNRMKKIQAIPIWIMRANDVVQCTCTCTRVNISSAASAASGTTVHVYTVQLFLYSLIALPLQVYKYLYTLYTCTAHLQK